MEYLRLSWEEIEEFCKKLAQKIKEKKLENYLFIGLSRGGLVPLRLISDYLGVNDIHVVRVQFYEKVGKTASRPKITHEVQFDIKGRDILVVDDIADTGESIIAAVEHMKERGARKIAVATLLKKPHSKIMPDLFVRETSAWVIFPWEVQESARDIVKKGKEELEKSGIKEEEIQP